jgi:HAD superfamily hydrolase (TIGR01509 family)
MHSSLKRIQAVIFDCDGTLVDSEELGFKVMVRQARQLGIQFANDDDLIEFRGTRMATCLANLSTRLGLPLPHDFEYQLRQEMAMEFQRNLKPMPGVQEMLNKLTVPYCVASNGPREKTELTLTITGLNNFFINKIFSAYEIGHFKPDPKLFIAASKALDVLPKNCAVVEDSIPGIQAGIAAGMVVYAVKGNVQLPQDIISQIILLDDIRQLADEPWN